MIFNKGVNGMNKIEQWVNILQASGCRITTPRRVVIEVLATSEHALQPLEVYRLSREKYPSIGMVTVYRTIERLENLGLLQRLHHEDGCHTLVPAAVGHQHYLVCTSCGRSTLFQGDDLDALFSRVESSTGYQVSEHWLQLFGVCPGCQENFHTSNEVSIP
jgi:Fe2+ or Zn2+ uptake regulation protein